MTNELANATEHIECAVEGMSAGQVVSLLLLGGTFVLFLLSLIWKIMDFRLTPLKDVPKTLIDIQLALGKIWTNEQLNTYIDNRLTHAIQSHEREYHKESRGRSNQQKN